jgi:hypothetical protein
MEGDVHLEGENPHSQKIIVFRNGVSNTKFAVYSYKPLLSRTSKMYIPPQVFERIFSDEQIPMRLPETPHRIRLHRGRGG